MKNTITASERSERLLIEQIVDEYRSKGFVVSRRPELDFLPGVRPDLVVKKNGETKIIEIKSRASLSADEQIEELARTISEKPGWSFELMMIGEPEHVGSPKTAKPLDSDGILLRIEDAEVARRSGLSTAAFLLAWSACEAAIRELLAINGIANDGLTTATHLLDQAVYHGIVSREDYRPLTEALRHRNAMVHGFDVGEFDGAMLTGLIYATRNVIEAIDRGPINDEVEDAVDFWPSKSRVEIAD